MNTDRRPANRAAVFLCVWLERRFWVWRNSPFCWRLTLPCAAYSTPFLWSCPKKRGGAPKKSAFGLVPTRERVWPHPPLPRAFGARVGQLRCPLRGRIVSLAPRARGLGWWKSSPVKVFCPAFLKKSGRGPGAEPLDARRSARNSPYAKEAQEEVKGEPSPGVPPLRAASAARSPRTTFYYCTPPRGVLKYALWKKNCQN